MDTAQLNDIADRLFDAFVARDYDTAETLLAPGATLTQNGRASTFVDARPMLEAINTMIGQHRYEQVRRVVGDDAIVEEHHVVSTMPDGTQLDLPACVVVRVDADGLISSLDEYVDTSGLV